MTKFKEWKDIRQELKFTEEEEEEKRIEREIVLATIEARKNAHISQQKLSELSGIIQPSISKIETFKRSPEVLTLMKLLRPLGYTLKVVPIDSVE